METLKWGVKAQVMAETRSQGSRLFYWYLPEKEGGHFPWNEPEVSLESHRTLEYLFWSQLFVRSVTTAKSTDCLVMTKYCWEGGHDNDSKKESG